MLQNSINIKTSLISLIILGSSVVFANNNPKTDAMNWANEHIHGASEVKVVNCVVTPNNNKVANCRLHAYAGSAVYVHQLVCTAKVGCTEVAHWAIHQ